MLSVRPSGNRCVCPFAVETPGCLRCERILLLTVSDGSSLDRQPTTGPAPSSRGLHVAAAPNDHTLIIFGGAAKDGTMLNDAFALDTRSWVWRPLAAPSSASSLGGLGFLSQLFGSGGGDADRPSPTPRAGACAASLPDSNGIVVCCGAEAGAGGLVPRADAWALTLDSEGEGQWTCLLADDAPNAPAPRNAATLTPLGGRPGELLLHGGWHPFVRTYADSRVLRVEA